MSTLDNVLSAWESTTGHKPTRNANGHYVGISPLRPEADSKTNFVLMPGGDEHGGWIDHKTGSTGSLYDLAEALGAEYPKYEPVTQPTKRAYGNLAEYALIHGVPESAFLDAGWTETTHRNRPALAFTVNGQKRWRFLDDKQPRYISEKGFKSGWYGLQRAIRMTTEGQPIVICNGEASTVCAQYWNVPACATSGGEKRLPEKLLAELNTLWSGDVIIAMDCDETGRAAAKAIAAQLGDRALVVDMGLDDGGDLADYCYNHKGDSYGKLRRAARRAESDTVSIDDVVKDIQLLLRGERLPDGKPVTNPMKKTFASLGGFAEFYEPGMVHCYVAPSGGGKTSFLETQGDMLNMNGENGLWYGGEWTEHQMLQRRIQRYTGVTFSDFQRHRIYLHDNQNNAARPRGNLIDVDDKMRINEFLESMQKWPGKTTYVRYQQYLDDILNAMQVKIDEYRGTSRAISYAVIDYVQLVRMKAVADATGSHEEAMHAIKEFTMRNQIVMLVGSQVTKAATDSARRGERRLSATDIQYLREDKLNLITILSIIHEAPDGENTEWRKTNRAFADVLKNNAGLTGTRRMTTDFKHLTWREQTW